MNLESALRDVANHQQQIARLQNDKGKEAGRAADALSKAAAAMAAASKTTNLSTRASKLREAQRHNQDATKYQKQAANLESKIASEQKKLGDAQKKANDEQKKLSDAQKKANELQRKLGDEQKKANDEQKKLAEQHARATRERAQELERASREQERRMRKLSGTLAEHALLHQTTRAAMDRLQLLPEKIQVLFLAANPRDQQQLHLDEEVRSITEMIRKSLHRDAVCMESRWAVRPLDIMQAINELRPRIVHFSGHGSSAEELVFQGENGTSKFVSKEAMVQTMAATADDIQLVFFNSCYSRAQAESVVRHVSAAIGMNATIGDEAARVFSSQFYSAVGFGHSVARAFGQAKAALMLEGIPEESTPELFVADGVDANDLILVRPSP